MLYRITFANCTKISLFKKYSLVLNKQRLEDKTSIRSPIIYLVKKLRSETALSELKGGPPGACYAGRPPPAVEASSEGLEVLLSVARTLWTVPQVSILYTVYIVAYLTLLGKRTADRTV